MFVLKYNAGGTLTGSTILEGNGTDAGYAITVDTSGNIYVTGRYISTTTTQINNLALSSTPVSSGYTFPASPSIAAFVLKYNAGGTLTGSTILDGTGMDIGNEITVDTRGNIYVTGQYASTTTTQINNLALNSTPVSSGYTFPVVAVASAMFVLKYNAGGTLTGSTILEGNGLDVGNAITVDTSGNIYVTGRYISTTTTQINNLALSSTPVSSGYTFPDSTSAAFVLKYNAGGTLTGSTIFDGNGSTDIGNAITVDTSGNIYVTGRYVSTTTTQINNLALSSTPVSSGYTFPASTTVAAFVLEYNAGGTLTGSTILDGTGVDIGNAITVDMGGNIYVTGQYISTTTTQINNLALNSTPVRSGYTFPAVSSTGAAFILKYGNVQNIQLTLPDPRIQTINEFTNLDGSGSDFGYSVATDSSGNFYVTGQYTASTTVAVNNLALSSTMDPTLYTLPVTTGSSAVFILKYNSAGILVGFTNLDGSGSDFGYSVATDSSGNFYVTGLYTSTTTVAVNNLALNSTMQSSGFTLPVVTSSAVFILKYNSVGTLVGFTNLDTIYALGAIIRYSVTTDSSGNFYVTGLYTSTTTVAVNNLALNSTMQSSGFTLPVITNSAVFILKYNSAGTIIGFTNLDGIGTDIGLGIATDSSGNFYVTGQYTSTTTVAVNNLALNSTMQSSGFTLPAATTVAVFILKYNSAGTNVGFTNLDGTGNDFGLGIATDSSGNFYVTGLYTSTTTVAVNNLALNSTMQSSGFTLPAATTGAMFILKYNSAGTIIGFTNLDGSGLNDIGIGIATDSSGNFYVTGQYTASTTVAVNNLALNSTMQSSGFTLPAATTVAVFILKYNSAGTNVGFTNLDGSGSDIGLWIATDSSGNFYVTGQYTASTTVAVNNLALNSTMQSSGFTLPAATTGAMFILKYSYSDTTLIRKTIYLQSPRNYYTINNGPSFLTIGPTSNVISADWTLDRWQLTLA
jgi:hypothetical protein